ncbi:hypothetical protein PIB30_091750, partial [Stylosanthes scabra]|nr:hypothetical protein [Stylosanthes scabra]
MLKTAPTFLFLFSSFLSLLLCISDASSNTTNKMLAVFAFGDSTIDPGHFHTLFRGDHLPYGCDFPNHTPTGRFSNGKILTNYMVNMLGIKSLSPAYLDPGINDGICSLMV